MREKIYETQHDFEEHYWWFVGRRAIVFDLIRRYAMDRMGRIILDAGCGSGFLTDKLQAFGKVCAIDFSHHALQLAYRRGVRLLANGSLDTLPFRDQKFDIITSLDVLEHLDDDMNAMSELNRICKNDGKLVIFVPAFQFLWSGEDNVSEHRRRYTRKELACKLQTAGFSIDFLSYVNMFLFPVVTCVILFDRFFRPARLNESNMRPLPFTLNRILSVIFRTEAILLRWIRLPFGTSLAGVVSKKPNPSTAYLKKT